MLQRYRLTYWFVLAVTACDREPTVCTAMGEFAVTVNVRDAATGEPAAFNATLVLREGLFADSVTGFYSGPDDFGASRLGVAEERPGTYEVIVRKTGYRTWTRSGVTVRMGRCGIDGVTLNVLLQRS